MVLKCKFRKGGADLLQPRGNFVFLFKRAVEEHESTSSGTHDLASQGARLARFGVQLIDCRIADFGRHLLLEFPGGVEQVSKIFQPPVEKSVLHLQSKLLTNLTRVLALEWAASGVTVNAICPGPFATEMNRQLLNDPVKYKAFVEKIPMGRWGELHEITGAALFLASDAASFVTGSSLFVDGGWTAQ